MVLFQNIILIFLACSLFVHQHRADEEFRMIFDQIGYVETEVRLFNWYSSSWKNSSGDELLVNLIDFTTNEIAKKEFEKMLFSSDEPVFDENSYGRVVQKFGAKKADDPRDPYSLIIWKNHFVIDINFLGSPDIGLTFERCCINKVIEYYTKQEYPNDP